MKQKFLFGMCLASFLVMTAFMMTSCKDKIRDEINQYRVDQQSEIEALQAQLDELAKKLDECKCDSCKDGKDGEDGHSPYIGTDGNWYVWDGNQNSYVNSGVPAAGQEGQPGQPGQPGQNGEDGHSPILNPIDSLWYIWDDSLGDYVATTVNGYGRNGKDGENGKDGHTPYIGSNGNWFMWDETAQDFVDSGIKAAGVDGTNGHSPYINETDSFWYVWSDSLQIWIRSENRAYGRDGANGADGNTPAPTLDPTDNNYYWAIDGVWVLDANGDKIRANGLDGQDGQDGATPYINADGIWVIGTDTTGVRAQGFSAYEIYTQYTTDVPVMTEEEWLASLHGANGADGQTPVLTAVTMVGDSIVFTFTYPDGHTEQTGCDVDDSWKCDEEKCINAVNIVAEITKAFGYDNQLLSQTEIAEFGQKVSKALKDIEDALKYIEALKKRATSLAVEAVNNNIFGMVKTSADIQTNMLFGFYGDLSYDFMFPSTNAMYYGDKSMILNDTYVTLNKEQIYAETVWSKLGTIYYSINPAEINFADEEIKLVNSRNRTNGIELTPVAVSNVTLKMGYTGPRRASGAQVYGFYESTAEVTDINAVDHIDLPVESYMDLAKEVKKASSNSISALATALRDTYRAFNTDAYALQMETEDTLSTVDANRHVVRSSLDIQAAVIKPVGYEAAAQIPENMPGYNKAINLVNKVTKKAFATIRNNSQLKDLKNTLEGLQNIQHIHFSFAPGTGVAYQKDTIYYINFTVDPSVTVNVPVCAEIQIYDTYGNPVGTGVLDTVITATGQVYYQVHEAFTFSIRITEQDLADFYVSITDQANANVASINDMIDKLNEATQKGMNLLNRLTGTDLEIETTEKIDDMVTKYWNKLDKVYGAVEYRFELALFAKTGNKTTYLSAGVNNPTKVNSSFEVYMTNFNAEMLVPAYKKHLCVTNAIGAADTQAAINAANASINRVYAGDKVKTTVSGLQSGVIYEIAYSGLDYAGKQETRYFYVQCK